MRNDPNSQNGRTHEPSLREVTVELDGLRDLLDERERRYDERITDIKAATEQRFQSTDKATAAAFAASEKAITKAESAQGDYNARSNEFRGQLADQASTLMPRAEAESTFRQQRELTDKGIDVLRKEVSVLRDFFKESGGRQTAQTEGRGNVQWMIGIGMMVVGIVVGVVINIVVLVIEHAGK